MSLLFCDSFDDRPISFIHDRYVSSSINVSGGSGITAGRTDSGLALSTGLLDVNDHIDCDVMQSQTLIVGCATQMSLSTALMSIRNGTTPHVFVQLNDDGTLSVWRFGDGSPLGTSTHIVPVSGFFYVELKAKIAVMTGSYELRVSTADDQQVGDTWLSGSGINTSADGNEFANRVRLIYNHGGTDGAVRIVDDFYVANDDDDGGDATVSDFAGPVKIKALQVSANGFTNSWTPNTGLNYQAVDEFTGEDGDTTYVASGTDAAVELYDLPALGVNNVDIVAVGVSQWQRREDALYRATKAATRTASANYFSDAIEAQPLAYSRAQRFFEKDPSTSEPWLLAAINAIQIGAQAVAP